MKTPGSGGRLIIVCGLPGSGKTALARQLQAELRAIRLSPDEWMDALSLDIWDEDRREKIEGLQWQLGQQILNLGLAVIIECGTWGRSERDALRLRARELGASVELRYLSAPVEVLLQRVQRRGMENPPVKREQLLQWASALSDIDPESSPLRMPSASFPHNGSLFHILINQALSTLRISGTLFIATLSNQQPSPRILIGWHHAAPPR